MSKPHLAAGLLFITFLVAAAWFHHRAPGWNVNSRLALTRSITEHQTLSVDAVLQDPDMETGDVARWFGKRYSDKTPGTSLLGIPAAAACLVWDKLSGQPLSTAARRYWITLGSVGLLFAALGLALRRLFTIMGEECGSPDTAPALPRAATAAALLCGLASPLWFYSTLFMGYVPTLLFLTCGLLAGHRALRCPANARTAQTAWSLLAGASLGAAVVVEFTAALAAGLITVYLLVRRFPQGWANLGITAAAGAVGVLLGWSIYPIYSYFAFGTFAVPYQFHEDPFFRAEMARGFMGIAEPRLSVALLVTVHPYRGLLFSAPWLAVGLAWWLAALFRKGTADNAVPRIAWAALSLAVFFAFVLFNSAYYMWWGGWSYAPRHLMPAVPFLAAGAAMALVSGTPAWRWAVWLGAIPGFIIHSIVNLVDPQTPDIGRAGGVSLMGLMRPSFTDAPPWPFTHWILPRFQAGALDANAGALLGLSSGWAQLILLSVVLGALVAATLRAASPKPPSPAA